MSFIVHISLPFTAQNRIRLELAGVAAYCKNIPGQDRLDYFNGVIDEAELKRRNPTEVADIDAQKLNWLTVISNADPPTTQTRYYGSGNMTQAQWNRIEALFSSLPAQTRYAKFDRTHLLLATNTTLTVGQRYTEVEGLLALGFRFYEPADQLLTKR